MDVTYVIARYKEDISWSDNLKKTVIQKEVDMPNVGREPASYFHFIVKNYDTLEGEYVFCQGNPFDHAPKLLEGDFGVLHECDGMGNPEHAGLPVDDIVRRLYLGLKHKYYFIVGCQFQVSADKIRERPKEFYEQCYEICTTEEFAPWVFERIIGLIF